MVTYCLHVHVPRFKYLLVIRKLRKYHFITSSNSSSLVGFPDKRHTKNFGGGGVTKHVNRKTLEIKVLLYAASNNIIIFASQSTM